MTRPKPCLGYPSRSAAAHALLAEGLTPRQIAARIEAEADEPITAKMVLDLDSSYRRRFDRRLENLPIYRAYLLAAAGIDRRRVISFLRDLLNEIEGRT